MNIFKFLETIFDKKPEKSEKELRLELKEKMEKCYSCGSKTEIRNIHRGENTYINYYTCTNCRKEKTISTYWGLGYSVVSDDKQKYSKKYPIFHTKILPWPSGDCPICNSKLEHRSRVRECKNGCYHRYVNPNVCNIRLFNDEFTYKPRNAIERENTYFKVLERIEYWKEDEKYVAQILSTNLEKL